MQGDEGTKVSKGRNEMEINTDIVRPADVRINIYENCRGEPISALILIDKTIPCIRAYVYIYIIHICIRYISEHICTHTHH